MTIRHSATLSDNVHALFRYGAMGSWTDGRLVGHYLAGRENGEAALGVLLHRHGPMVLGVCRRVLGDAHLAEDAFQATFLILVRKAATLQDRDLLANWLYGVAFRISKKTKVAAARRDVVERRTAESSTAPAEDPDQSEIRAVIDEEIRRLPERYRVPLVLCYFEGLHHHEAARRLGCPVGTVESRLSRARERLRSRLIRRGLAPTSAGVILALTPSDVSAALIRLNAATIQAAGQIGAGPTGFWLGSAISMVGHSLSRAPWPHAGMALTTLVACTGVVVAGLAAYRAEGTPVVRLDALNAPPDARQPALETAPQPAASSKKHSAAKGLASQEAPLAQRFPSAVAAPLTGISIDGRLDDWPKDSPRHWIRNRLVGSPAYDPNGSSKVSDADAYFMVGYDRESGLIYLAAVVPDRDVVAKAGDPWHTDALEVYLDGAFSERTVAVPPSALAARDMPALQYVGLPGPVPAYSDPEDANPSLLYGRIASTTTKMRYRTEGGVTTYEWALQPFDRYPGRPTQLEPGKRLGLDIAVVDKDPDRARPSFLTWAAPPSIFKGHAAGDLGELILGNER